MLKRSGRFNLLIVRGGGTRILRLHLPRWLPHAGLTLVALVVALQGAIVGDYLSLRRQRAEMAALREQVGQQRALIDLSHRRLAEVREEIASWQDLHAKIWEPLGPEERGPGRRSGVGGGIGSVPRPILGSTALGTELDQLSIGVSEEGQKLRALARLVARVGNMLAALPSRWPVRGSVNSEFGRRLSPWSGSPEFHDGMDIAADVSTPVRAPAPGIVVFAGTAPDYGKTLIMDHGQGIRTLYGHLQKIMVVQGQKVERGQPLALTGNTGRSSGPHLHYEITVKGQPVDPRGYLWD